MSLHIGLDGSRIAKAHYTGTEHYSHAIFEHMFRVAPNHRYIIYAPTMPTHPLDTSNANVEWKIIPFPRLWTQFRLSTEMLTGKQPDVLFIPSHTIPLVHPRATVTTVHDLGFLHFPEYYGFIERAYQSFGLRQAVNASTRIISVSQATKDDLLKFTKYPENRISVIHHGVDRDVFRGPNVGEQPPGQQQATQPYLYTIGRIEAKKNIPQLLRAFRILKEKHKIPHQLVLAGKPGGQGYQEIEAVLKELPDAVRSQIQMLGYVSDEDHAVWLRFASCLVFPSGFEGFGLPALEAMASRVPVVVSGASSLPEIVGDAGVIVNHTRAEAIAEGVMKVLSNTQFRTDLIEKGRQRIKQFSWERAALQTIGVLETAAEEARHAH